MAGAVGGERVLVVDDDPPLQRMLARTLTAEGFDVRLAADGGSALLESERAAPDVIVLDVALPGGLDGLAVARRLRGKGLVTPILMLTARDGVPDRIAGLEAGADDYLVKPFAVQELVARIRALLRRGSAPAEMLAYADLQLDVTGRRAERAGRIIEFTEREATLLALLLAHQGRTVTREHALAEIWHGGAESNVVDRYITRLRQKLGEPPLIRTVRGSGFMLRA